MSRRNRPEDQLQHTVVAMLRFHGVPNLIWHSIPNEGHREPRTAARLKRLGLVPGVADLVVVTPGGRAAYLELKTKDGRQSTEQRAFQLACELNGTPYAIARTPEQAAEILHGWGALVANPLNARRAA